MFKISFAYCLLLIICLQLSDAFVPSSSLKRPSLILKNKENIKDNALYLSMIENEDKLPVSRRSLLQGASLLTIVTLTSLTGMIQSAHSSGGATAGGAYLLSAKQRYNQRVTAGVKAFVQLSPDNQEALNAYFSTDEVGGWNDISTAGYLLANAFRRSSTTPPDSLPSVKKWKAFASQIDNLKNSLKKKDSKAIASSYDKAINLLDAYLEVVELPPAIEMRQ
jgi:hypothetical protein